MSVMPTKPGARLERFLGQWTSAARKAEVIGSADEVVGMALLAKRQPYFGLTSLFQRYSTVLVTQREIIVTPWVVNMGPFQSSLSNALRMQRPQSLSLSEPPKRMHLLGNRVSLPQSMVEFLGQDTAHVQYGLVAERGFEIAGMAPRG